MGSEMCIRDSANIAAEVAKLEARVSMIKDKIAYKMGGEEA